MGSERGRSRWPAAAIRPTTAGRPKSDAPGRTDSAREGPMAPGNAVRRRPCGAIGSAVNRPGDERERGKVSGGEVAGILVAVFWAILVSFLAVALARLAQTLRATTELVADVTEQAVRCWPTPPRRCAPRRPSSTGSTPSPRTSRRSPPTPPRCPPPSPPPSAARWSRSPRSATACAGRSAAAGRRRARPGRARRTVDRRPHRAGRAAGRRAASGQKD